jgi:hypothetical protein
MNSKIFSPFEDFFLGMLQHDRFAGEWIGVLSDVGEKISLKIAGVEVDSVFYSSTSNKFPAAANGLGKTLVRKGLCDARMALNSNNGPLFWKASICKVNDWLDLIEASYEKRSIVFMSVALLSRA